MRNPRPIVIDVTIRVGVTYCRNPSDYRYCRYVLQHQDNHYDTYLIQKMNLIRSTQEHDQFRPERLRVIQSYDMKIISKEYFHRVRPREKVALRTLLMKLNTFHRLSHILQAIIYIIRMIGIKDRINNYR